MKNFVILLLLSPLILGFMTYILLWFRGAAAMIFGV